MKSQILIVPSNEAVISWKGFSGFTNAAVIFSEWPAPDDSREAEPLDVDDDSVEITFPETEEYIFTDVPTMAKK